MGLFDKKYCDVCGDKIGLLGNRKLDDGNLCKSCAEKLSPWFTGRRHSTVQEIKSQLEYREENKAAVAAFHTTRTFGTRMKVLLDEDNRKFIVTAARDLAAENPDVLDYSQITGCRMDVEESRHELKYRLPDGKEVAYNPPQYEYDYDFYMIINVNNPYFDEIRFQLNNTDVTIEPTIRVAPTPSVPHAHPAGSPAANRASAQKASAAGIHAGSAPARPVARAGQPAAAQPQAPQPVRVLSSVTPDPKTNTEYAKYQKMGDDLVAALTQVHDDIREEITESNAPKVAVTCPWCGAPTIPDANGCCEYCGGALNG